jgi:hypothetical protein
MSKPRPRWFRPVLAGSVVCVVAFWAIVLSIAIARSREEMHRTVCYGNYKLMSLAFHNEHDRAGRTFPAWTLDEDGERAMSWRVAVLPWMDSQPLFDSYDASQPWDAPANQRLRAPCFRYFSCPTQDDVPGEFTRKAAVTGPGTVFEGAEPMHLLDSPDGASNTAWAGEISFPLPWTKPEDVEALDHLTLDGPRGFSGPHARGVPFSFCDGSSRFLSKDIDPDMLRRLFLRGDESAAASP